PSVALYVFYRIGSRNERPGATGLSHYFEHMMFNGAKKYGPGDFDRVMESRGGANNAYTSRDVTVYQDWFPSSALELIFEMEADRIRDLAFDAKMIENERGTITSERRQGVENDNFGLLDEQLWATAFVAHPYQWPVIGWMSDIENWKREDLERHFRMGYAPANATLVVVGDISHTQVVGLAERYLEPIPSGEPPPRITTREPQQEGERRVEISKFAQLPIVMVAYHVPETAHADFAALTILKNILLSGQSSRIYRRLVETDAIAIGVAGEMPLAFDPTLLTITMQPKSNIATETLEQALFEEIEKVRQGGIEELELQKAKNALLNEYYQDIRTINRRCHALGVAALFFNDYRKLFTLTDDYGKVTREDVQRVAQAYLGRKNRTVATLRSDVQADAAKAARD
ncbi:MAG: insulinase family protein, partial [Vicinamibacteria bacterium]|nr:insulinase family protein [Vicinamibacteria bacterium]